VLLGKPQKSLLAGASNTSGLWMITIPKSGTGISRGEYW